MPCFTCVSPVFKSLGRAAAKSAGAKLREFGVFADKVEWAQRAAICERCPMRVIFRGTSHCGKPFTHQIDRDDAIDGCGCPTVAKAKDPSEHCPVDHQFRAAVNANGICTCKWCVANQSLTSSANLR